MSRQDVGIAIRDDTLSAVAVAGGLRSGRVSARAQVPLAEGSLEDVLPEALAALREHLGTLEGAAAVSLPGNRFHFRHLRVPFTENRKIRQVVPLELEPVMAFAPEDLIADFLKLPHGQTPQNSDICVAALLRERLRGLLGLLTAAGIDPDIVTIGAAAMVSQLPGAKFRDSAALFADIDTRQATIAVVPDGAVGFLRSVPLPAEPVLRTERLAEELERTRWAFCHNLGTARPMDRLILAGEGLSHEDTERFLAKKLKVAVERFTVGHVAVDDLGEAALNGAPPPTGLLEAWCLAQNLGNGGAAFNFRRGAFARRTFWEKQKRQIIAGACLAGLAGSLALGTVAMESRHLAHRAAALDARITGIFREAFPDAKRIVDPAHQMAVRLKEMRKEALVPGGGLAPYRSLDILDGISRNIPAALDVELTRLVSGPEGINLTGHTDSFNAVDAIKRGLERSGRFETVTITSANMEKDGGRVAFKLKLVPS